MHLKRNHWIRWFRKLLARFGMGPARRFDPVVLASPLNHPRLVEQALSRARTTRLSWFFDPGFYLESNEDVAKAGMAPYPHFLRHGLAEGRSPHPLVNLKFLAKGMSRGDAPWSAEELAQALRDNRSSPHPLFDPAYYLRSNKDVRESEWSAFEHFLAHGAGEGRAPSEGLAPGGPVDAAALGTRHDSLLKCRRLIARGRAGEATETLGGLLLRQPGDPAVQALVQEARRAASGLADDGSAGPMDEARRELDLLEAVLIHLERRESRQ